MGFKELLLAGLVAQGAHTGGHYNEASKQGVPINLHGKEFSEAWDQPKPKLDTDINGGGFSMQDEVGRRTSGSEVPFMNAILKAIQLSGAPNKLSGGAVEGDIPRMERQSGNKHVDKLVAASAISDLLRARNPKQDWDLQFSTFGTGQPGLIFNKRF